MKKNGSPRVKVANLRQIAAPALVLSLGLNACLGWFCLRREKVETPVVSSPAPLASVPSKNVAESVPSKASHSEKRFSWQDLQTPEFPDYITRLRGIGCPEATIRDIIKGELDEIYSSKRQQLQVSFGEGNFNAPSKSLQRKFEELVLEEDALLKQLMGGPVGGVGNLANSDASAVPAAPGPKGGILPAPIADMVATQPLTQPLIFQEVDTTALNLTSDQQALLEGMRDSFRKMVGGDPQDPEYENRWRKAQYQMDQQLRITLGNTLATQYRARVR